MKHSLYTSSLPELSGHVYATAPRPLPGLMVGHVGTTAFPVYVIDADSVQRALDLGAEVVLATTDAQWAEFVQGQREACVTDFNGDPGVIEALDEMLATPEGVERFMRGRGHALIEVRW